MSITDDFLKEQITEIKALIKAYQAAELQIATDQIETYTLDTNQSRQTVTKQNLAVLKNATKSLYNQLEVLCTRVDGSGSHTQMPGW